MTNSSKNAILISCSDHYSHRLHAMDAYLKRSGYETTYITSDFDHTSKKVFKCGVIDCVQLHAKPYTRNLSLARILSHRGFARDVFRYLAAQKSQPDVIVALLPPNFLAHYAAKYRKKHPEVKIIFDIFDLWPETFPSGKMKKILSPAFRIWSGVRDHNLDAADFVTTECEMFRKKLNLRQENSASVFLCAKPLNLPPVVPELRSDQLDLCYLGAINNIIGIPEICTLIRELVKRKPVILHVIGKGEREAEFLQAAREAGAEIIFYGAVYDDARKQEIMSHCHFGLNLMKSSVCIGLTMKSVDYFRFGLPIISNIPADTQQLVAQGAGIQMSREGIAQIAECSVEQCLQMRQKVRQIFDQQFSFEVIQKKFKALFDGIL